MDWTEWGHFGVVHSVFFKYGMGMHATTVQPFFFLSFFFVALLLNPVRISSSLKKGGGKGILQLKRTFVEFRTTDHKGAAALFLSPLFSICLSPLFNSSARRAYWHVLPVIGIIEIPMCGLSSLLIAMVNVVGLTGHSFLSPVSMDTVEPGEKLIQLFRYNLTCTFSSEKRQKKEN